MISVFLFCFFSNSSQYKHIKWFCIFLNNNNKAGHIIWHDLKVILQGQRAMRTHLSDVIQNHSLWIFIRFRCYELIMNINTRDESESAASTCSWATSVSGSWVEFRCVRIPVSPEYIPACTAGRIQDPDSWNTWINTSQKTSNIYMKVCLDASSTRFPFKSSQ